MIVFMTLCMVVLPGLLLVLVCGLIEWLIGKLDKPTSCWGGVPGTRWGMPGRSKKLKGGKQDEINPGKSKGNDGAKQ